MIKVYMYKIEAIEPKTKNGFTRSGVQHITWCAFVFLRKSVETVKHIVLIFS